MLRALFFDFDGLIVDTETPEVQGWEEAFAEHGLQYPVEYWSSLIGAGPNPLIERPIELLARLAKTDRDMVEYEAKVVRRQVELKALQPILPGVGELAAAALREGLHTAVVSSSRHIWVDGHLERLGIATLFEHTICRDDVTQAKPFPDLYLRACELFAVQPCEAIAFEDSSNGAAAAVAAGVFVIAIPNRATQHMNLSHASTRRNSIADITVTDLRALLAARTV